MTYNRFVFWVAALAITAIGHVLPAHAAGPIQCLLITGDHGHDWKATTPVIAEFLAKAVAFTLM